MEDVHAWLERPPKQRYSIGGIHFRLRRDRVATEVIYTATGVEEDGYRQILGFRAGGQEKRKRLERVSAGPSPERRHQHLHRCVRWS